MFANNIAPQTENPKVRLPVFGSSRPLCENCVEFLRASFSAFGANTDTLDRIVPHGHRAYSEFCMPHGSKPAVVEEVAVKLEYALEHALVKPLRNSFHALAKSVGGHLLPSPDPLPSLGPSDWYSDWDTASDASEGILDRGS